MYGLKRVPFKLVRKSPEDCRSGERETQSMVSFVVRMKFASEDRADVVETLRVLAEASRKEPGCVNYIAHHLEEDPDTVLIYEQYRDASAQAAHRTTDHFKKHAVGGLFQKMRERSIENLIALD
jgi:quinol monooxygenase YgiN